MQREEYWSLFEATGAPYAYMLYKSGGVNAAGFACARFGEGKQDVYRNERNRYPECKL